MKLLKTYIALIASIAISSVFSSCVDEEIYREEVIGEGEASVAASVSFKNFTPALESSRGETGEIINSITNLTVFIYDGTGQNLVATKQFSRNNLTITTNENNKPQGSTSVVELPTEQAECKFNLDYGKYKIYAVANIPDNVAGYFTGEAIANETALKSIVIPWSSTISNDGVMFGYFTATTPVTSINASSFDAPVVSVNAKTLTLNAWLRRLASKVTIGFDPSGLYEGVSIYVKSATIRHIPRECYLGQTNSPASTSQLITDRDADPIQVINYYKEGKAASHDDWMVLQNGTVVDNEKFHGANAESLFFFENCQGNKRNEGESFNKQMNSDEMNDNTYVPTGGHPDGAPAYVDYKDKVPYGTFVEVEAYYTSANEQKISSGPIRYRFMLGKNTTYDYNAERNYHYKLTLKFKGWANEPDWHIDYEEPEHGIQTPEEYFISYLYNQNMSMPVRLTNPDGIAKLRAEIIVNNWAPYDPTTPDEVPAKPALDPFNYNHFTWNREAWEFLKNTYNESVYHGNANFLGFLALRALPMQGNDMADPSLDYSAQAMEIIKNFYVSNKQYYAEYDLSKEGSADIDNNSVNGSYSVRKDNISGDIIVDVPMWTRAKALVQATGFSGNNPYNAYRRKAVVRFTAWDKEGKQVPFQDLQGNEYYEKDVPILQTRRVVNPKAIWRSAGCDDKFDVSLSVLWNPNDQVFTPLTSSVGPWRASIMVDSEASAGGASWFTLTKDNQTVTTVSDEDPENVENYIHGDGGSLMEFTYKPNGPIPADQARYGIIKIEYMNYSCVHLIMVRQGYDAPAKLGSNNWSTYNVYAMQGKNPNEVTPQQSESAGNMRLMTTNNPLSIGSMFKRANYQDGIMEINNNTYGQYFPVNDDGVELRTVTLNADGSITESEKAWNHMPAYGAKNYGGDDARLDSKYSWTGTYIAVNHNNRQFKMPTFADFSELMELGLGVGVAYGDECNSTATTESDAYGFYAENNGETGTSRGMRVFISYDPETAHHILFPLGVDGQGRRTRAMVAVGNQKFPEGTVQSDYYGTLSYSGVFGVLSGDLNRYRPITYNLYRNPGAVYWFQLPEIGGFKPKNQNSYSWDMGYYSIDFSPYADATLGTGTGGTVYDQMSVASDALPIRLIYK